MVESQDWQQKIVSFKIRKMTKETSVCAGYFKGDRQEVGLRYTYRPEFIQDLDFDVIDGDRQIVNGVSVMQTYGHSPCGQSVIIDTAKGKAVISGCCCVRENFEPPEELGMEVIPTGILIDPIKSYESLLKIKNTADIIIPLHDAEFLEVDRIP